MRADSDQLVAAPATAAGLWPDVEPVPHATTLWEAIEGAATSTSGMTFVDAALTEDFIDYGELCEAAVRVAGALRERGLEPGDRVGLVGLTSRQLICTLAGCWRADLIPTLAPLPRGADVSGWIETLKARLGLIGASATLVEDQFAAMLEPVLGAERTHAFDALLAGPPLQEPSIAKPTDVAYLQFTSGSTGSSRAASIGHTQILWNACHDFNYTGQLRPDEARALWIPLFHDFGLVSSLAGIFAGAPVILQSPEQFLARPSSWMDMCSKYEAAFTAAPNAGYGVAARDLKLNPRDLDLSRLRACINGSEPIDMETIDKFMDAASKYGIPEKAMSAAYGMAEVTLAITWTRGHELLESVYVRRDGIGERGAKVEQLPPDDPRALRLARCGKPDEATELRCIGPDGEVLPEWTVGEVHIKGPSVMQGYFNEPEATAAVINDDGWLVTGDLGFHVGDREMVLCGRIKDMIIVAGRNLYPQDFEFMAERVPGVRKGNATAFSLPGTERMVLVFECKQEGAAEVGKAVQDRLRDEFDIRAPEVVVVGPGDVPKTSSGKRQRGICRAMYEAGELPIVHTTAGA